MREENNKIRSILGKTVRNTKAAGREKLKASHNVEVSLEGIMDEEINIVCNMMWICKQWHMQKSSPTSVYLVYPSLKP